MQRQTTYIVLIAFLFGGLLLIYRFILDSNQFNVIKGKVLSKKVEAVSERKGRVNFALTFDVANSTIKPGIHLGTNWEPSDVELLNRIDTNNIYTFFIDPTVTVQHKICLGLRKIELNGRLLYKDNQAYQFIFGIVLTFISAGGLFLVLKYRRRKNVD